MVVENGSWNLEESCLAFATMFGVATAGLQLAPTENALSVVLTIQINLVIASIIKVSYLPDILGKSDKSRWILCWNSTF